MSFLDDLQKASNMFSQGAKALSVQDNINDAAVALEKWKTTNTDATSNEIQNEKQFRQGRSEIANQLAARLAALDADQNTINTAFQSLAPQTFSSGAAALQAGDEFAAGQFAAEDTRKGELKKKLNVEEFWETQGRLTSIKNVAQQRAAEGQLDALTLPGLEIRDKNIPMKAQLANYGKAQEYSQVSDPLVNALMEINTLFDKYEVGTTGGFDPEDRANLQRLSASIQLFSKDATYKLGVLNGADADFLRRIMPDLGDITAIGTMDKNARTKYKAELNNVLRNRRKYFQNLNYEPARRRVDSRKGVAAREGTTMQNTQSVLKMGVRQPSKMPASTKFQKPSQKSVSPSVGGGQQASKGLDPILEGISNVFKKVGQGAQKVKETVSKRSQEFEQISKSASRDTPIQDFVNAIKTDMGNQQDVMSDQIAQARQTFQRGLASKSKEAMSEGFESGVKAIAAGLKPLSKLSGNQKDIVKEQMQQAVENFKKNPGISKSKQEMKSLFMKMMKRPELREDRDIVKRQLNEAYQNIFGKNLF